MFFVGGYSTETAGDIYKKKKKKRNHLQAMPLMHFKFIGKSSESALFKRVGRVRKSRHEIVLVG